MDDRRAICFLAYIVIVTFYLLNLIWAYYNNFYIKYNPKSNLSLLLPLILAILYVAILTFQEPTFAILFIILLIYFFHYYNLYPYDIFYYLRVKTFFQALLLFDTLGLSALLIIHLKLSSQITTQAILFLFLIFGVYSFFIYKGGLIALSTQLAINKNIPKELGLLGALGNIGLFLLFTLSYKKLKLL